MNWQDYKSTSKERRELVDVHAQAEPLLAGGPEDRPRRADASGVLRTAPPSSLPVTALVAAGADPDRASGAVDVVEPGEVQAAKAFNHRNVRQLGNMHDLGGGERMNLHRRKTMTQLAKQVLEPVDLQIGVQAAQLLIDRVENADRQVPARQLRFEPYLALRDSTAGPKE
mgnify:CR=1 FL=1